MANDVVTPSENLLIPTGPPYPPPYAGYGLGRFRVGISTLGSQGPFNIWNAIISQYANSPIITQLVQQLQAAADQTENFDNFYDQVLNLDTAVDFGLDVWGRILKVSRILWLPEQLTWFGFQEAGANCFNTDPFFSNLPFAAEKIGYRMPTQLFRRVLQARAMYLCSGGTIPQINAILRFLFIGRGGNAFIQEGTLPAYFGFQETDTAYTFGQGSFYDGQLIPAAMQITINLNFEANAIDLAIIQQSGVIPRPAGSAINIRYFSS